jgi:hypothetical protein
VGYKLRREVRDALPPDVLTAAERLLVLELADTCGDDTREGWPGAAKLAELTDLSERSIQEALNRIGKKWVELRVPLGKSDTGRVYYSYAGRRTTFRFPILTRREGATDPGSYGATDPGSSEPEDATDRGGRCDGSVEKVRQIRGPSPQRTPQKSTPQPPPTPSSDLAPVEVVDAEIVEEGEGSDSFLEAQVQKLIDEAVTAKPNWRSKRADIRAQFDALLMTFGGSFDLAAQVVRETALAGDTGWPSRITLAQNPAMRKATAAYQIATLDALGDDLPGPPAHPNAHEFDPDTSGLSCKVCQRLKPNGIHRVPTPRRSSYQPGYRGFPHWEPPADQSEYDKPLYRDPAA